MNEERYRAAERRVWESLGVETREVEVELATSGTRVRVQEVGHGPAIMFVHGTTNAGASWAPLVARLDGFHRIVVDRPGCGLSEPPPAPESLADYVASTAALVPELLDGLGLDDADVVATSLGSLYAFHAAAAHPDRVRRLVSVAFPIGAPADRLPLVMRLAAVPAIGRVMTAMPPTRAAVKSMLRQIGLREAMRAGRVSDPFIDWFLAMLRDTDTMRNELDVFAHVGGSVVALLDELVLADATLDAIRSPVTLIWGERDLFGGADVARAFAARLGDVELVLVPNANHAPWIDDPDDVAELVSARLADSGG